MQIRIDELREKIRTRARPPFNAAPDLDTIARPRLTGTSGAAAVTGAVRSRFQDLGYQVDDRPFEFSAWPGRFGLSAAGAILLSASVAAGVFLLSGRAVAAIVALALGGAALAAVGLFAGRALDALPWGRQVAVNLLARRPERRPRYLIMAHRDSKSQLVPLLLRAPALVVAVLGWATLLLFALLSLADPVPEPLVFSIAIAAVLAGTVVTLCWADDESPGALDNATGVAALIGIAERESEHGDVAFLITDAEELGLAGARAAARRLPAVFGVINLDGLDDEGTFYVLERFGWPRRGLAPHLALALLSAAAALDVPARRRDVPFGVMLDHMPIVNGGTTALTLMRGELSSMRRVHRPADSRERIRGAGVSAAVELVCTALGVLRTQEPARPD